VTHEGGPHVQRERQRTSCEFSLAQCLSHGGCRETAKARSEEERFCRELEAVQKAERLAGLNAAQVRDRRTHNTHCCRPGGEQG
jgi:hypothetical protein